MADQPTTTLTPEAEGSFDRAVFEAGATDSTASYATVFALRGVAHEIAALRHALTPKITFTTFQEKPDA